MPGFVVDAASLVRISHRLGVLHGQLESAPEIVGGYDATMLGGATLQAELDGFAHQWRHEMTTVAGELDLMQMRLADASAAYERIEHRHRASAHAAAATGSGTTVIDPGAPRHGGATGSGVGSGTTVIDGGSGHGTPSPGGHRSGTGSGTTVIGGSGGGSGSGSGSTTVGGSGGGSAPVGGPHGSNPGQSTSGSGTTVIGGGSGSSGGGSGTTVIGSARQPVPAGSAGPAGSGFSSPLLTDQAGPAPGR